MLWLLFSYGHLRRKATSTLEEFQGGGLITVWLTLTPLWEALALLSSPKDPLTPFLLYLRLLSPLVLLNSSSTTYMVCCLCSFFCPSYFYILFINKCLICFFWVACWLACNIVIFFLWLSSAFSAFNLLYISCFLIFKYELFGWFINSVYSLDSFQPPSLLYVCINWMVSWFFNMVFLDDLLLSSCLK